MAKILAWLPVTPTGMGVRSTLGVTGETFVGNVMRMVRAGQLGAMHQEPRRSVAAVQTEARRLLAVALVHRAAWRQQAAKTPECTTTRM